MHLSNIDLQFKEHYFKFTAFHSISNNTETYLMFVLIVLQIITLRFSLIMIQIHISAVLCSSACHFNSYLDVSVLSICT